MSITRNAVFCKNGGILLLLILCLALILSCNATAGEFDGKRAANDAIAIGRGPIDPSYKVFNVLDFGAKPDGREDEEEVENTTMSMVRAFRAACNYTGKVMLLIPKKTFLLSPAMFVGPCNNTAPLVFNIQGYLKASTDMSMFPGQEQEWITFQSINGLIITGGGTFDGQGASAWKGHKKTNDNSDPWLRLVASIHFNNVTNAVTRGIKSINSKGFHILTTKSKNIRLYNLHITAPGDSPNTDGIHISESNTVKIANSFIGTGDDCIGILRGSSNISIKKVFCGPGHGISIGTLGKYEEEADVRQITVKNCTLDRTENGIRIKTNAGKKPTQASKLMFHDIYMKDVKNPIIINQYYENKKESIVKLSDIRFTNIFGTTLSKIAVDLECSKVSPCKSVHLTDINLKYNGIQSKEPFSSKCTNVKVGYHGKQLPPPCP